ncbi:CG0192-related protein [Lacisediminihabitans sp. H27-G8]|uniref:CG0192-related protein n=1 Tax=Lacisediminihabitans sp. H27-G8 TaxID=3111909 RepID=UPI0038FCF25C
MALLHRAQLTPSKIELVSAWAPTQPWFPGSAPAVLTSVASYRFDDPDGEVGIETLLVRVEGGPLLQLPLTYRAAPLASATESLIGTMEHSVLGTRWVYDATADPVYLAAVTAAAFTGGVQADEYFEVDGERVARDSSARVTGSGNPGATVPSSAGTISTRHEAASTAVEAGGVRVVVARVLDAATSPEGLEQESLAGTWPEQHEPRPLVRVSVLS